MGTAQKDQILSDRKGNSLSDVQNAAIADYFIGSCATAYYCDLKKMTLKILQDAELDTNPALRDGLLNVTEGIAYYAEVYVHPEDRAEVLENLSVEHVRYALAHADSYSFMFRDIYEGSAGVYRCTVLRGEDVDHVAVFFQNITEGFRSELEQAEAENAHRSLAENNERIMALEDNFESLYDVDLETGEYLLYNKGQTFSQQVNTRFFASNDFFGDSSINTERVVWPEDRAESRRILTRDYIRKALEKDNHIDWYYRLTIDDSPVWFRLRIVYKNPDKHNIIVGVFNAEAEVAARKREEEQRDEIINTMVGADGLFLIDCARDTRKTLHNHCYGAGLYTDDEAYSVQIARYIDSFVAEPDRAMMHKTTSVGYMLDHLRTEKEYTVEYRDMSTGIKRFYEMKIAKLSDTEILQSFAEKDREIIDRLILSKLKDNYFALYCVDMDSGLLQVMKDLDRSPVGVPGIMTQYRTAMTNIASIFDGETRDFFERISDIGYLKQKLEKEDKFIFSYMSENFSAWVDVTFLTIQRMGEVPTMVAVGFNITDSMSAGRQDLQKILHEDMQMIGGLAGEYLALLYVNMDEGTCKPYSLDEKLLVNSKKYLSAAQFGPEMLRRYGHSELVHPDDRYLFDDIDNDSIRTKLAHRKKFTTRFRRLCDGEYRWFDMDIVKYEPVDDRANAIAICFADRDSEIRTEQAITQCYDILSKEIRPDEAIEELLTLAGEHYAGERAYIFEYYDNKELVSNTYEWCADGVEAMKDRLQDLPASDIAGWTREFEHHGAFYMDILDCEQNTPEAIEILKMQGIESLIAAPIMNGDEVVGFIGVDNPTKAVRSITLLKNIAVVAYSEILKRRQTEMVMYESAKIFSDAFLDSYVSAYYVNLADHSQVVINRSEFIQERYGHIASYLKSIETYIDEFVYPDDRAAMHEAVQPDYIRMRLKTVKSFSVNMRDMSSAEGIRWYRFDVSRGADEDHVGLAFSDVTELIEQEQEYQRQLKTALDAADVASRSKTSFLFNMSHDIRTPLNAIKGFTSMAKKNADDKSRLMEYLDKIEISGKQLLTLINQVLEMSRIESGKVELNEKPCDVRKEHDSLIIVLEEQAKAAGLEFHCSFRDVEHNCVLADEARLESITLNIVGNAMKYTPRGGRIDVDFREVPCERDGYARYILSVADTGIGMSEEFQKVLFEPFSREKNSTVSKIQGTGLGMSIVKNLVELMNGTIGVTSKVGKGTRFDVTIDLRIDEEERAYSEVLPDAGCTSFEGLRVLLAEDNEMNREIAKNILEENGMIVEEASDGDMAVEIMNGIAARGEPLYYDFILMDVQMPKLDGYAATKAIRAIPGLVGSHVPIIAMTANAFEEDRQDAIAAGMDDHLAKPIDVETLLRTLAKYV